MSATACPQPLGWESLVRYFAAELPADEESALEAHAFACAGCAERMAGAALAVTRVRDGARTGAIMSVITPDHLESLRRSGVRLKEATVTDAAVNETSYDADVDLLIARIHGDFAGLRRIDVEFHTAYAGLGVERDVPVVSDQEVLLACTRHHFRAPAGPLETLLKIVDADDPGRRVVGQYQLRMRGEVMPRA